MRDEAPAQAASLPAGAADRADIMAIKCGIVGLPNVGKSTLFNALTRAQIAAENYPFCTIDPNVGVVPVPDRAARRSWRRSRIPRRSCRPRSSSSISPDWWPGASQGEGLGNQFLAHIREVDAIAHVVRCFDDDDIVHVAGSIDPLVGHRDVINTELALADLATVDKALERAAKAAKSGDKEAAAPA